MKKFTVSSAVFAALTLSMVACDGSPLQVDLGDDSSATAPPDAGAKPDVSSTEANPSAALVDNDGDGVVASKDCNDNNALVHPWAPEICNGKDDDCDGVIDEGCTVPPSGNPPATGDSDGDGYPNGPTDCAPNNALIHPGAVEVCNGIDDNCDGVIDEGCTVPPSGNPPATAKVEVSYPDNAPRTLNVQAYDDKSDLGGWWDKSVSSTSQGLMLELAALPLDICGFRLNVSEGNPANSWLCAGNGSTASLDPDATVKITFNGHVYGKAQLMTWSAPGGTAAGCSALLKVSSAAACQP